MPTVDVNHVKRMCFGRFLPNVGIPGLRKNEKESKKKKTVIVLVASTGIDRGRMKHEGYLIYNLILTIPMKFLFLKP